VEISDKKRFQWKPYYDINIHQARKIQMQTDVIRVLCPQ
jgi:hypothetical protein